MTRAAFLRLLAASPAFAQTGEQWDFLEDASIFPDIHGVLPRYLKDQAFAMLAQRERAVAELRTMDDLHRRRDLLRERIWSYLGGQPERTPLNPRVVATIDRGDHRIEKVIFESRPAFYVTANVYLPKAGTAPYPAILFPLGHELGAKAHSAWQRVLVNLTRRGFVCLAWDPIGQGERVQFYDPDWHDSKLQGSTVEHTVLGLQCYLLGTHVAQFTIWDGIRALDYLVSRPEVDKSRIGCTGNSGGGTHTAYLSALDDRISVAAPSCYITSWRRLLESIGPQDAEQVFPNFIQDGFDFPDYLYAFAPKPYLILSAIRDFFPIGGARASYREAKDVFGRLGAAENIQMFEADDGHGYTQPRREAAYRWFTSRLQSAANTQAESPVDLLTPEELNCTRTGQVKTSFPDAADAHSILQQVAARLRSARQPTRDSVRRDARQVIRYSAQTGAPPVTRFGQMTRPDCRVEKLVYESEAGVPVPTLVFVPNAAAARKPAILFADSAGKAESRHDAEQLAGAGFVVFVPDLRGFGETQPPIDRADYFTRNFGDYENATTALLIGQTMVGMRTLDVLRGLEVLAAREDIDRSRIGAVGRSAAALPVLFAALFDERISSLLLERMLVSYEAVLRERIHQRLADQIVPSVLKFFDIPDVVAALAPRRVALLNSVNPLGQEITAAAARSEYAAAVSIYESSKALEIERRDPDVQPLSAVARRVFL